MAFLEPHDTNNLANQSAGDDFSLLFNDFAASDEGLAWLTEGGALEHQPTNALPRPVPTDMSTEISKPTRDLLHGKPPPLIPSQFQQPTNPIRAERPVNWTTKSSPSSALGNRDFATKTSAKHPPPPKSHHPPQLIIVYLTLISRLVISKTFSILTSVHYSGIAQELSCYQITGHKSATPLIKSLIYQIPHGR